MKGFLTTWFAVSVVGMMPPFLAAQAVRSDPEAPEAGAPVAHVVSVADRDRDQRFLKGLVERRMFRLAETFCAERRDAMTNSPSASAEWTGWFIGTLAEHALQTENDDRDELWERIDRLSTEFYAVSADNPWLPLVRYQTAQASLVRAELAVVPVELGLADSANAFGQLAVASKRLEEAEEDVARRLRRATRGPRTKSSALDGPSPAELRGLQARLFDATGRGLLLRARIETPGSPDQLNSCIRAIDYLEKVSPRDVSDTLWDQVRIHLLTALRLKGDFATAESRLDRFLEADVSATFQLMARAEQIRLAIAQDDGDRAQLLVTLGRKIDGTTYPDLDIARLEAILFEWQRSSDAKNGAAASWREKAVEMVAIIESEFSPAWLHRAETLLSAAAARDTGGDADLLRRTAKNLYLRGQLADSVRAYDEAARKARSSGDADATFDLALKAAAIQRERGLSQDAEKRFRAVATEFPENAQAPSAHEMAVLESASRALQANRVMDDALRKHLAEYEQLLKEHLTTWPTDSTTGRVAEWLAKLYQFQGKDWLAATTYLRASDLLNTDQDLVRHARTCFIRAINESDERDETIHKAIGLLRQHASHSPPNEVDRSVRRRSAALISAELQLRFSTTLTDADLNQIVTSLDDLLKRDVDSGNLRWRDRAYALIIVANVRLGKWREAESRLDRLDNAMSATWFELLAMLADSSVDDDRPQRELGEIQLKGLDRLQRRNDPLSAEHKREMIRWRASALLKSGRHLEAQIALESLVDDNPKEVALRELFAESLLQSDEPATLTRSLQQWRTVLKQRRPGSDAWFRAKYGIALTHCRLGQFEAAADMIRLLKVLHPDLGSRIMQQKFQKLLDECADTQEARP